MSQPIKGIKKILHGARQILALSVFMTAVTAVSVQSANAQTSAQDSTQSTAQVGEVEGEDREAILMAPITAEPARPLIQFTNTRPKVSFTEVRVGPSSRTFYPELRLGSEMEVGSPAIDILVLFPGIIP